MKKVIRILTAVLLSAAVAVTPVSAAKSKKNSKDQTETSVSETVSEKSGKKSKKETAAEEEEKAETTAKKKEKAETAVKETDKDDSKSETTVKDKDKSKSETTAKDKSKDSKDSKDSSRSTSKTKDKDSSKSSNVTVIVPTVCFDTDYTIKNNIVKPFGSVERTAFSVAIDKNIARTNGSLALSQEFAGTLESSARNTGFYISAESVGLEDFSGMEISFYIYAVDVGATRLRAFTDGDIVNYSDEIPMTKAPRWEKVTMNVPEDVKNNMFGVVITADKGFSGTVCYIDDISVKNTKTTVPVTIKNIGDFKQVTEVKTANVFTVILFVILILAVAGACAVFVLKMINRYR